MKTNLLTLLLCVCYISVQTQVAFQQQVVIDSTYGAVNPRSVAIADIDNDGYKDLLIVGYGDAVWARSTNGAGNFENRRPLLAGFVEAEAVAAADFDGDGDQDVIVFARADNNTYALRYLENMDGLGNFAVPISLAETPYTIHLNLQVLDMDNDGDVDIAYSSSENISWLENTDGQATFEDHYLLGDNEGFYAVDVDGDEISDIIGDFGYDLRAYKLNADGSLSFFETMNTFSLNNDHKAADIDGDGDNDVVTFFENGNTRQVHWYENTDGLGFFNNRQVLFDLPSISASSNNDRKGLEIVDVDNDGLLDVVTFESRQEGMSWYKNLGDALFDTERVISNQVPTLTGIAIADLNNDGTQDIVFTDYILSEYAWYSNQDGAGDFGDKRRISSYAYSVNHVDYGDIDGDGDLDLISSSHGDNKLAWYENTSSLGHFLDIQQLISTTTENVRDAFAVDMDGDTDLDVLVFAHLDATTDEYQLLWFENDGAGNFINEHVFESTEEWILRINYADIDNDGDMDVISGQDNSVLALYKNNGDGT
ncbi:MAG: VCBS repeat-containing protein, partial [Bacteroidota bacterium]